MDRIGKMDSRIIVQQPTDSQDAFGGTVRTWATYVTRWAAINYAKKAGEQYEIDRKASMYTIMFTIRSDSGTRGINPKMRILFDGKVYDIRAISERADEYRKMYLLIEAEQKSPEDSTIAAAIGDEAQAGVWGWSND